MQAQPDAGKRISSPSVELEEIKRLKRENKELRDINHMVGSARCTSVSNTKTVAREGLVASIGTVGDEADNEVAETATGMYKMS